MLRNTSAQRWEVTSCTTLQPNDMYLEESVLLERLRRPSAAFRGDEGGAGGITAYVLDQVSSLLVPSSTSTSLADQHHAVEGTAWRAAMLAELRRLPPSRASPSYFLPGSYTVMHRRSLSAPGSASARTCSASTSRRQMTRLDRRRTLGPTRRLGRVHAHGISCHAVV